ncbi:MAG: gliding motility-associated C-terminal domain-containing protein [Prevotellaceae bacterium]|jgi:hypothetical protein|nr:gliding motility-associated C-terminal domain-containing protein [Prevotellaceae bacterium]
MKRKLYILSISLIILFSLDVKFYAQSPSTQGTEFWVTFMKNYQNTPPSDTAQLSLMVSAKQPCTVTISNPNTGYTSSVSISANIPVKINIAASQCYNENSGLIENRGLHISSTDTISLFASNFRNRSFDVANILPVTALSDEYIVQTYKPYSTYGGEFVIVANEDNTTVDIIPTATVAGASPVNGTVSVNLNRGQTYQLIAAAGGSGNLAGTYVKSRDCKKIAVFNGNVLSYVPSNNSSGDHLFEQAVPVAYWGKEFAITGSLFCSKDRMIITASKDNTGVFRNGSSIATLNAYESHEIELLATDTSCFIETSEPCAVYLYLVGSNANVDEIGDPSMLWISPTEQKIREITFGAYETDEIHRHYVNIVVETSDKHTVRLDGTNISSRFSPLHGNPDLSFAKVQISNNTHTLQSSRGVIAHVYGLGYHESYAYSIGSAMEDLLRTVWINDEVYSISGFADKYICVQNPIKFYVKLNYQHVKIEWDFGDGNTATGDTVYHAYQNAGTYQISAIIERITADECNGSFYDTVTAHINISDYKARTDFYEEICPGKIYSNHGHTFAATDTLIIDTIPTAVCDSFVYIHVTVMPEYNDTIKDTICLHDTYNKYDFHEQPATAGTHYYVKNLKTSYYLCDSTVTLQLTVNPVYNSTVYDTVCQYEKYNRYGFDTTMNQAGNFTFIHNDKTAYGCDSIVTLYLKVWQSYTDTIKNYTYLCSDNKTIPQGTVLSRITANHVSIHGCDSIVADISIHTYNYNDTIKDTICLHDTYNKYNFHENPATAGTHYFVKNLKTSYYLCDSIVTLQLTVNPAYHSTVYDTVCQYEKYNRYGFDTTMNQAGNFTFVHNDKTAYGCDSTVTLHLKVWQSYTDTIKNYTYLCSDNKTIPQGTILSRITANYVSIHGCDSIVADISIHTYIYNDTIKDTICLGERYNLNGFDTLPSATGLVHDTLNLSSVYDCDSVVYLNLFVLQSYKDTVNDTICLGDEYHNYNFDTIPEQSGNFILVHYDVAKNGCDSLFILNLFVRPIYYDSITVEPGNSLGIYCNDTLYHKTIYGCDSIIFVTYIGPPLPGGGCGNGDGGGGGGGGGSGGGGSGNICNFDTVRAEICLGESYNENGFHLTPDSLGNHKYWHFFIPDTANDCIYLTTLFLEVLPVYRDTLRITVCSSDTGIQAGTVLRDSIDHLTTNRGCDSIIVYRFIHHHAYYDTIEAQICSNEEYHNATYNFDIVPTGAGFFTYTQNHKTAKNCDSIITLLLTVNPAYNNTIYDTVCRYEKYNRHGFDTTMNQAGNFTFVHNDTTVSGCDSIVTLYLTVWQTYNDTLKNFICSTDKTIPQGTILNQTTTNLTTVHGCDSIVTTQEIHCYIYNDTIKDTICLYDTYNKYDFYENPATEGTHYYVKNLKTSYYLCDSTVTLQLTVNTMYHNTIYDTICQYEKYNLYNFDTTMNQAGNFTFVHNDETLSGCDSIVTLYLTVWQTYNDTLKNFICSTDKTIPQGTVLNQTTTNLTTVHGCDSIVTTQKIHCYIYNDTIKDTICLYDTYNKYDFYENPATAGTHYYVKNLKNSYYLCDSTVTLQLMVNPAYHNTIYDTICQYEKYNLYNFDTTMNQAGNFTFVHNDTTAYGCDSITTLYLKVNPAYNIVFADTACSKEFYDNYGFTLLPEHAGDTILIHSDTTAYGCDSITTLILTVYPSYNYSIEVVICTNANSPLRKQIYNEDYETAENDDIPPIMMDYSITNKFKTVNGCDSIVTLLYNYYPSYYDTVKASICLGEHYKAYNFDTIPTIAGIVLYSQNLKTYKGCDSITTLLLSVNPVYFDTIYDTVCQYDRYNKYNFDTLINQSGNYTLVNYEKTVNNCDSITTLLLRVNPVYLDVILIDTVCQYDRYHKYNFDTTINQAGDYMLIHNGKTINGCDSITTLYLRVNPVYNYTISATICLGDNYNLNGFNVTPVTSGISNYTQNLLTVNGCDSIVNLHLTVNPSYSLFITDTIYEDEWSYVGHARYNTPGIHVTDLKTKLGCDSIIYLDLYVIYYPTEITAFSPFNKDGINDYLYPGFKVQIFNRYGIIIYETKTREEQDLGWDGRNNRGQQVEPGMYFYILYNSSGKPRIKSSVEVLKLR